MQKNNFGNIVQLEDGTLLYIDFPTGDIKLLNTDDEKIIASVYKQYAKVLNKLELQRQLLPYFPYAGSKITHVLTTYLNATYIGDVGEVPQGNKDVVY